MSRISLAKQKESMINLGKEYCLDVCTDIKMMSIIINIYKDCAMKTYEIPSSCITENGLNYYIIQAKNDIDELVLTDEHQVYKFKKGYDFIPEIIERVLRESPELLV